MWDAFTQLPKTEKLCRLRVERICGEKIKDKIGHFYTSKCPIGTVLHICEEQVGHFYTSMACKQDTFTPLDEASGILLHI